MKTAKLKLLLFGATVLLLAGISSCSKKNDPAVVSKVALNAEIAVAANLMATTSEGVAAGNYLQGSQAELQIAIDAATVVANNANATQEEVTNATASLTTAVAVYQSKLVTAIDPTNLVGQWTFDEIGTVAANAVVKDYSGNGRDGAIKVGFAFWGAGTPTAIADRYGDAGKALHFDEGANVEVPYSTELNPPVMSLSVWAKPDVNDPIVNNQYFISMNRWNGYKFNFQNTPRAFFTATYDNGAGAVCCYDRDQDLGTAPQGAWHHYIVTFGEGHTVFYIDGDLVHDWDNTPGTIAQLASPVNLVFGQALPTSVSDNDGGFYIGALDEVRIYKSILTQAQVTSIYNLEKP